MGWRLGRRRGAFPLAEAPGVMALTPPLRLALRRVPWKPAPVARTLSESVARTLSESLPRQAGGLGWTPLAIAG